MKALLVSMMLALCCFDATSYADCGRAGYEGGTYLVYASDSGAENIRRGVYEFADLKKKSGRHSEDAWVDEPWNISWIRLAACAEKKPLADIDGFSLCEVTLGRQEGGADVELQMSARLLYDECLGEFIAGESKFFRLDREAKLSREVLGKAPLPYSEVYFAKIYR